jgi:hypothetical protein
MSQVGGEGKRNWPLLLLLSSRLHLLIFLLLLWEWKAIQQEVYDARWLLVKGKFLEVQDVFHVIRMSTWYVRASFDGPVRARGLPENFRALSGLQGCRVLSIR